MVGLLIVRMFDPRLSASDQRGVCCFGSWRDVADVNAIFSADRGTV